MRQPAAHTREAEAVIDQKQQLRMAASVARTAAAGPEAIEARLEALDREWDVDRVLVETRAASAAFVGLALSVPPLKWLPRTITALLVEQGRRGWEPPSAVLRIAGVRSAHEIDRERTALKLARGYRLPAELTVYPAWQRLAGNAAE
jgi:hypothetical protein